ncbi:hypothetical protein G7Y89_g11662 [Cudoniella acicularis]|uniref:Uncharacterized protein n=1 Tax=Cudoniella acicularis TaxID=354080 RepID=A0A8H4RD23_9HELO|nr:hypothetical protein G7Y89_g11662 [Cudoniella acicularis]
MGKRKQPRPQRPKPLSRWPLEDELALLGLLDFCIKHKQVFPFNEENVVGHLSSAGSSHDGYTWGQISRKLGRLWHTTGRDDSVKKADIYEEGSACVGFTEDERGTIKSNVERLEKLLKPNSLRKRVLKIPVTRKAISASPFTIKGDQSRTPECDTHDRERLTPRAQRHQTRELAKQSTWEWESPELSLCEDESPRKRSRPTKNSSQNRCNQQGKEDSEDPERGTECLLKAQLALEDNELKPFSENEKDNNSSNVFTSENHDPHEFTPLRLGSEIRRLQGDEVPSPITLERIHRAILRKKEEKILELQETINANEEQFQEFQTQLDSFGSVQERRQEGGDSLELFVSNLNQEIRHLKTAKDDCRKIGTFTKLAGSYDIAREEMHIETRVPIIRRLMKNILGGCDDDTMLKFPGPNISAGLRALLSFRFRLGLDGKTPLGREQFESLVSNRPPYSVIETLIEAAVCTWVFESGFPNFEREPGSLSLFTKYRELIAAQDGAVALRNLELASYHALVNSPRFHNLTDKEAEDLAASLSKTLAPLFSRNAEESEENVFETWGEEESVWKARRQRLIAIFKDALKMKAGSLLTPERYELVYYAPGTVFDLATMDVETIDGAPVDAPVEEGHIVEHCLHVAIQAFTRETVKDVDPVSKATIQSKNFTRGDAAQPSGGTAPTVLAKAVVVLRK